MDTSFSLKKSVKAGLVAGGHWTDIPIDSVHSAFASLRGAHMTMFLAELNGLDFWSTDIGTRILESNTMEKFYVVGGRIFARNNPEGHTMVIIKALYVTQVEWSTRVGSLCGRITTFWMHSAKSRWSYYATDEGPIRLLVVYADGNCFQGTR
jgi:hypothetical protein